MIKNLLPTMSLMLALAWMPVTRAAAQTGQPISTGSLSVSLTGHGTVRALTWTRPGSATPVDLAFRQDGFSGFSWQVNANGGWSGALPLVRLKPGVDQFALNAGGIVYSLAYSTSNDVMEVIAGIENKTGTPFSPDIALVTMGIDCGMASYPEWNHVFFPTLLRCEKTHFWGYLMRPDGVILGIASPDPVSSWANNYNDGGHRLYTPRLDLLNKYPQPGRHPQDIPAIAPGETRQWRFFLTPVDTLANVQPRLSDVAGIPMISLDRPTVEFGQYIRGNIISAHSPIESLTVTDPGGKDYACNHAGGSFAFAPAQPGVYTIRLKTADGKVAEAMAACRMPWSWYARQARANAVSKPQKASTHCEGWLGLISGYVARRYFPDADLDKAVDAMYDEIEPLLYNAKYLPIIYPERIQNSSMWASMLVARYRATGDIQSLRFAAALADFLAGTQNPDGAYHDGSAHYTCVTYIAKSVMEVMAAEKPLAETDPEWKACYARQAVSVRRAIDDLVKRGDNIGTEGEATYEDGMIACEYSQLAMYALLQTDPALRQKYLDAAIKIYTGHRCLSQIVIPDCRMNGGSLRYWEAQYDILTGGDMMSSPHGWSAWRLYGLWYLYQLTGEREYLREAMNGLSSCAQLIDFKTGDLRWGFIVDPCLHANVVKEDPAHPGKAIGDPRVIGEQYMPMISGWERTKPGVVGSGYSLADGSSCDNDVHEIFKCLGEIALTSAYVIENADGSLETWNCKASRNARGAILVIPAEPVVSRIHLKLKKPAYVEADFNQKKWAVRVFPGMTWFGPGGIPEEIRP